MSKLEKKFDKIRSLTSELNTSVSVLADAVKGGDTSLKKYDGAVEMLFDGVSSMADLCKDLIGVISE